MLKVGLKMGHWGRLASLQKRRLRAATHGLENIVRRLCCLELQAAADAGVCHRIHPRDIVEQGRREARLVSGATRVLALAARTDSIQAAEPSTQPL